MNNHDLFLDVIAYTDRYKVIHNYIYLYKMEPFVDISVRGMRTVNVMEWAGLDFMDYSGILKALEDDDILNYVNSMIDLEML